jgi:hypothetical protein
MSGHICKGDNCAECMRDDWFPDGESCPMCCGPVDDDGMTLAAIATGARSAETNEDLAQSEGRQSGGEAASPNPDPGPPGVRS